jgi:hypothetical protein
MKWPAWILLPLLVAWFAYAENKPIQLLYAHDILEARSVAVVIYTGSEAPAESPQENQRAVDDVRTAMLKRGRYMITTEAAEADLIIAVRKGRAQATTISGAKNPNPVVLDPSDSGVRIGIHKGQTPPLSRGENPQGSTPSVGAQAGPSDDLFEVYRGRTQYPLDEPPVWRYLAKDGLKGPKVDAVNKFRKAVEEAAKKNP